jgi:hypothetical protein
VVNEKLDENIKLGTVQLEVDVLGPRGVGDNARKVDFGLLSRGKLNLHLLSGFTHTLDSYAVAREVNAVLLLELVEDMSDEGNVEVFSSKVSITIR